MSMVPLGAKFSISYQKFALIYTVFIVFFLSIAPKKGDLKCLFAVRCKVLA